VSKELRLAATTVTTEDATLVVDKFWEQAHPKPITPYNHVRGIVRRCLEAGYQQDEIIDALSLTDAYTISAIEYTLRSSRRTARSHLGGTMERILMMRNQRES
jgi:hypothetical protein